MSCAGVTVGLLLCVLFVHCEVLKHRLCGDVGLQHCTVYRVELNPCKEGSDFCRIRKNKKYTLSVDFMPEFSAKKLNLTMSGDDSNTGIFSTVVDDVPSDACSVLACPIEDRSNRKFDIDFVLGDKFAPEKFPIQVMLFDRKNENSGCCFNFDVKVIKPLVQ